MTELVFLLGFFTIIILATIAALNLGNISGLRSYRGAAIVGAFVGSWIVGWLAGQLFIPLSIVAPIVIQVLVLCVIGKLTVAKSLIISVIYTLATTVVVLLLSRLMLGD